MTGPVTLSGSASPVALGDGVSLVAPGVIGTAAVQPPPPPTTEAERLFSAALSNAGLDTRQAIVIAHSTSASADVQVTVPPVAGNRTVLAVTDESGVISWHFAAPAAAAAPPQTALAVGAVRPDDDQPLPAGSTFTISSARFGNHPASPLTAAPSVVSAAQDLFGGGGLFHKVIKIIEFPIASAVGQLAADLFGKWEQAHRGPAVTWFPPKNGLPAATLSVANWHTLAEGPALLFIHGIFSDCPSCFGGLASFDFWPRLQAKYQNRIFAYNHPTASVDPLTNVRQFLEQVPPDVRLNLDIISHSRGGLVARVLAGQHPDIVVDNITVHNIIFAGTPNGGTAITDPANWEDLFDRFTNLMNLLPPGPLSEASIITTTVLQVIKFAAESAERSLPGLDCMQPTSDLYSKLAGFTGQLPAYYAIDTNFVPPLILSHLFNIKDDAANAGDALVDRVFDHRPNDVAVPTIGVGDPGDASVDPPPVPGAPPAQRVPGFPVPDERHHPFGPSNVWHCSYFTRQETADQILRWLDAAPATDQA